MSSFYFTITDLGLFLNKAPVTIRGWERAGLISIPRDQAGNRKLSVADVKAVARRIMTLQKISPERYRKICDVLSSLEALAEKESK